MSYSSNPADFQAFTREQAIANLNALDDDAPVDYASKTNEELAAEVCMAGIVRDSTFKGVFSTEREALAAVYQAKLKANG